MGQNITNDGFHGKPLIFFFFWPGIHWLLFEFWVVFTKMVAEKIETLVVFMEGKKKNWNHLVPRLGLRTSALRFALGGGPKAQPGHQVVSIYFIFAFHETTKVSIFLPPFSWNHPKFKQIINETRSKKKKEWFPIKTGVFFKFLCPYNWTGWGFHHWKVTKL